MRFYVPRGVYTLYRTVFIMCESEKKKVYRMSFGFLVYIGYLSFYIIFSLSFGLLLLGKASERQRRRANRSRHIRSLKVCFSLSHHWPFIWPYISPPLLFFFFFKLYSLRKTGPNLPWHLSRALYTHRTASS